MSQEKENNSLPSSPVKERNVSKRLSMNSPFSAASPSVRRPLKQTRLPLLADNMADDASFVDDSNCMGDPNLEQTYAETTLNYTTNQTLQESFSLDNTAIESSDGVAYSGDPNLEQTYAETTMNVTEPVCDDEFDDVTPTGSPVKLKDLHQDDSFKAKGDEEIDSAPGVIGHEEEVIGEEVVENDVSKEENPTEIVEQKEEKVAEEKKVEKDENIVEEEEKVETSVPQNTSLLECSVSTAVETLESSILMENISELVENDVRSQSPSSAEINTRAFATGNLSMECSEFMSELSKESLKDARNVDGDVSEVVGEMEENDVEEVDETMKKEAAERLEASILDQSAVTAVQTVENVLSEDVEQEEVVGTCVEETSFNVTDHLESSVHTAVEEEPSVTTAVEGETIIPDDVTMKSCESTSETSEPLITAKSHFKSYIVGKNEIPDISPIVPFDKDEEAAEQQSLLNHSRGFQLFGGSVPNRESQPMSLADELGQLMDDVVLEEGEPQPVEDSQPESPVPQLEQAKEEEEPSTDDFDPEKPVINDMALETSAPSETQSAPVQISRPSDASSITSKAEEYDNFDCDKELNTDEKDQKRLITINESMVEFLEIESNMMIEGYNAELAKCQALQVEVGNLKLQLAQSEATITKLTTKADEDENERNIESLKGQVEELQKELKSASLSKELVAKLEDELSMVQKTRDTYLFEKEQVQFKLEETMVLVESLRGQVEDSKQREVELNAKIAEGLVELAEIKEKLAAMPETVATSVESNSEEVDKLEKEIDELRKRIESSEKEASEAAAMLDNVKAEMSVECSKLKSELADAMEVNDELRSELSSNVGKMESLEQEVHVLQANLIEKETLVERANDQVKFERLDNETTKEQLIAMEEQLKELQSKAETAEKALAEKTTIADDVNILIAKHTEEVEEYKKKIEDLETAHKLVASEKNELKSSLSTEVSIKDDQILNLQSEIDQLKTDVAKASNTDSALEEAQQQVSAKENVISTLKSELESAKVVFQNQHETMQQLEKNLEEKTEAVVKATGMIDTLKTQLTDAEAKLVEVNSVVSAMEEDRAAMKKTEDQLEESEKTIADLKSQLSEQTTTIEALGQEKSLLEETVEELKSQFESSLNSNPIRIQAELEEFRKTSESQQQQMSDLSTNYQLAQEEIIRLQQSSTDVDQLKEQLDALEQMKENNDRLSSELQSSEENVSKLQKELSDLSVVHQQTNEELSNLQQVATELDQLKGQVTEMQELKKRNEDLTSQLSTVQQKNVDVQKELEDKELTLSLAVSQKENIANDLMSKSEELDTLKNKMREMEKSMSSVDALKIEYLAQKELVTKVSAEKNSLQQQLQTVYSLIETEKAKIDADKQASQAKIASLTEENSNLTVELKEVADKLRMEMEEKMAAAMEETKKEMEQLREEKEQWIVEQKELSDTIARKTTELDRAYLMCDEFDDMETNYKKEIGQLQKEVMKLTQKDAPQAPALLSVLKQNVTPVSRDSSIVDHPSAPVDIKEPEPDFISAPSTPEKEENLSNFSNADKENMSMGDKDKTSMSQTLGTTLYKKINSDTMSASPKPTEKSTRCNQQ